MGFKKKLKQTAIDNVVNTLMASSFNTKIKEEGLEIINNYFAEVNNIYFTYCPDYSFRATALSQEIVKIMNPLFCEQDVRMDQLSQFQNNLYLALIDIETENNSKLFYIRIPKS